MAYVFRDQVAVLGGDTTVELNNGAAASTNVKIPLTNLVTFFSATAPSGSQVLFIAPPAASVATGALPMGNYKFAGISATFTVTSASGTVQVFKDTGVSAPGSGTALMASALALSGTANTVVSGFPSAAVSNANATIAPGERLSITFAGTLTNLANLALEIYLVRV